MPEYPLLHPDDLELLLKLKLDLMLHALDICCLDHGAEITLIVKHTDGTNVIADMYVHAALIQGLKDALEYFKSEL